MRLSFLDSWLTALFAARQKRRFTVQQQVTSLNIRFSHQRRWTVELKMYVRNIGCVENSITVWVAFDRMYPQRLCLLAVCPDSWVVLCVTDRVLVLWDCQVLTYIHHTAACFRCVKCQRCRRTLCILNQESSVLLYWTLNICITMHVRKTMRLKCTNPPKKEETN